MPPRAFLPAGGLGPGPRGPSRPGGGGGYSGASTPGVETVASLELQRESEGSKLVFKDVPQDLIAYRRWRTKVVARVSSMGSDPDAMKDWLDAIVDHVVSWENLTSKRIVAEGLKAMEEEADHHGDDAVHEDPGGH